MPISTYTLADFRGRLAERWEGVPFWSLEDANDAIREVLQLWNLLTGQWRTRVTIATTPNTYDYPLPASLVFGARVQWGTTPLTPSSLWDLDHLQPGWRQQTTATAGAPSRPMVWIPVSLNLIHLWPADAVGGTSLLVDGVAATPALSTDGAAFDCPEELFSTLLDGALHIAAFSEGGDRFLATFDHWRAFLAGALEHNQQLKGSVWFRRYLGLDRGRDLRRTHARLETLLPVRDPQPPRLPMDGTGLSDATLSEDS